MSAANSARVEFGAKVIEALNLIYVLFSRIQVMPVDMLFVFELSIEASV